MPGMVRLVLLTLVFAGCATSPPVAPDKPAPPASWCTAGSAPRTEEASVVGPAVVGVGDAFRAAHQRARAAECARLENEAFVLRYAFGGLEARWKGHDLGARVPLFPQAVHVEKTVCHDVFLASLLFEEREGSARDEALAKALAATEQLAAELKDASSMASKALPGAERPRQQTIVDATLSALKGFQAGTFDAAARRAYFTAMRPELEANLRFSARTFLETLHAAVESYRKQVDPAAFSSMLVIVASAHQARARDIGVQYFERLLAEPRKEGALGEKQMVVTEGLFAAGDQRGALAGHDVDRLHAAPIFGDAERMQWDVLGDSAELLDAVLPRRP